MSPDLCLQRLLRPEFHRHNRQPPNGLLLNYSSKNMYNNPQYKHNQVYNLKLVILC